MTKVFCLRLLLVTAISLGVVLLPSTGNRSKVSASNVVALDACDDCLAECEAGYHYCITHGGTVAYCNAIRFTCHDDCINNVCFDK